MALSRLRQAKSADEEARLVESAVPKSARYKNKWAYGIFEQWQKKRLVNVRNVEVSGLSKDCNFHLVQWLDISLIEMNALSLHNWLSKFVPEVAKSSSELGGFVLSIQIRVINIQIKNRVH